MKDQQKPLNREELLATDWPERADEYAALVELKEAFCEIDRRTDDYRQNKTF
jgi:hypothetical protein